MIIMRNELAKIDGERSEFIGTFVRFGEKDGYRGPVGTVLVRDVRDKYGEIVTDHIWFNLTKGFDSLNMKEGDIIEFRARVKKYLKGYMGHRYDVYSNIETDYKLSHPSKVKKLDDDTKR